MKSYGVESHFLLFKLKQGESEGVTPLHSECNIYSVAVTWGFNSEKILSQRQPHYIAKRPEDIV